MRYFFVLGNNPTLSIAEITALQSGSYALAADNVLILQTEQKINCGQMISRLGGTIKIGVINTAIDKVNFAKIYSNILPLFNAKNISGKFNFGISGYNIKGLDKQKLGLELKKYLKNKGISSRWVTSREPTLSSVVVEQNKLINRGLEVVLIGRGQKILLGQTLSVQPFKQLSFRDYGRPSRDDLSGMLPPKLAQIMINLALSPSPYQGEGRDEVILDPFCGSGTILTEAMLMAKFLPLTKGEARKGLHLIGSDISPKAINNTKDNIAWIKKSYELRVASCKLINTDATKISQHLKPKSVDAIITEPYLGPQRGKIKIEEVIKELNNLYSQSLAEVAKVLKPNGRVVMVWPVFRQLSLRGSASDRSQSLREIWRSHDNLTNACLEKTINPDLSNFKIINPIPENLQQDKRIKLTDRNTIIYGREQQKIWREIVVLEKG